MCRKAALKGIKLSKLTAQGTKATKDCGKLAHLAEPVKVGVQRQKLDVKKNEIQIDLRTISFVSVFMLLCLAAATFAFITTLIAGLLGQEQIAISILPLGMVILRLYLWNFGFSIESDRAQKVLIDILLAKKKNGG